jgi:creatinine amidohydrolase
MQLQLATWHEVEGYLAKSRGIIMPIGSTEQHGPNGLIGTDALCAEVIGRGVGDKTGACVAPTIAVGMAQHHLGFAGSMTLRPSTLIQVIKDCVQSLQRHGFERFFFVNGHGGNIATVTAAFSELHAERSLDPRSNAPGIRCALRNWWTGPGVQKLSKELFGDSEGSHATPSEVAVTQYAFPDSIKSATLEPKVAPRGSFHDADDYRRRFPDGRIGSDPGLATPEHGKRFYDMAVEEVAQDYMKFVADDAVGS